jgi:hypothetical protein
MRRRSLTDPLSCGLFLLVASGCGTDSGPRMVGGTEGGRGNEAGETADRGGTPSRAENAAGGGSKAMAGGAGRDATVSKGGSSAAGAAGDGSGRPGAAGRASPPGAGGQAGASEERAGSGATGVGEGGNAGTGGSGQGGRPSEAGAGTGGSGQGGRPSEAGAGTTSRGGNGAAGAAPAVACGSRDVPIDSEGWVQAVSTGCNIEGAWWWDTDDLGTTVEGVAVDEPPYVSGKGMCIKGKTIADPTWDAYGAIIGLDLNSNLVPGWDATPYGVVGFDIELTGSSTAELRLEYESRINPTEAPPFVPAAIGRNVVLIDRAVVPPEWDVPNAGEEADPANIRKLQLHAVGGGDTARDFDVCIRRVRPIVADCTDYEMIDANGYQVNNNPWGKESLTDYSQCVFATGSGDDTRFGWIWRWPVSDPVWQVRGYPEVMAGRSPWNAVNTGHGLPAPTTSQVAFTFDLDLVVGADDAYDFAPEVWLTSDPEPSSSNIQEEIMFWLLHHGMSPAGSLVDTFSTGGVDYDLYLKEDHDPGGGSTTTGWTYVAFVAQTEVRRGTLELKPFVDHLVQLGTVDGPRYYAGVELGTEIVNGSGSAIIKDFSVGVVPTSAHSYW